MKFFFTSGIGPDILMNVQKQPSRSVLRKRCSENMQQIYRRTPMPKCDFNKVALLRTLLKGCFWMCLKITLYSLPGQPGFYLTIISSERFSFWSFTENTSFITFHGGIWSGHSQINKFKISKDLSFPNYKKH